MVALIGFSIITVYSTDLATFGAGGKSYQLTKHLLWILIGSILLITMSKVDYRYLQKLRIPILVVSFMLLLLVLIPGIGTVTNGARRWIRLGHTLGIQPSEFAKIAIILILSKYFSRRHVEIRNIKHIFISGFYALVPFILILLQPDFGSAMIVGFIWLGMVLVSGLSKTHLLLVFISGVVIFTTLWMLVFAPYQKARIYNFINPLADIHGTGYNAFQSTIAVGSGQILGKGLGFGTQSRLKFLPQPQSDFIFAAYAEEWGFVGSLLILVLYGLVIWRILYSATLGSSNFEILFGMGIAIFFMSHILINIGMNLGLMPVTGIPLPFMSYGGSHLLTEFAGLGILMSMKRYGRALHRDDTKNEFLGA